MNGFALILQVGGNGPAVGVGEVFVVHERNGPRGRVFIFGAVHDFTAAEGCVAVFFENLLHGFCVGQMNTQVGFKISDAGGVGAQSGEHAHARRSADGLLTVVVEKDGAARGEPVDVGCLNGFVAVASKHRFEVVHRDEQDV